MRVVFQKPDFFDSVNSVEKDISETCFSAVHRGGAFAILARMTPNEIFARMPASVADELLAHLFENEKPLYKNLIETLAKQRKLRPVFIERKPRAERFAWIREALGRKVNEGVAAHLLQIWLVGQHSQLLCDFLDALGIAHDANGTVEELPPQPAREPLDAAINAVLEKHPREVVSIYLHAFQALDDTGWPLLDEILKSDERLKLSGADDGETKTASAAQT